MSNKQKRHDTGRMRGVLSIHNREAMEKSLREGFVPALAAGGVFVIEKMDAALRSMEKRYRRMFGLNGKNYRRSWTDGKVNGDREVARRLRQIERGMLRRENGLVAGLGDVARSRGDKAL